MPKYRDKYLPPEGFGRSSISRSEHRLYEQLKKVGLKAERQVKIGEYRVDFLIGNLIVEVEGSLHNPERDAVRTQDLESRGYFVLRVPAYLARFDPKGATEIIRMEYMKHFPKG